MRYRNRGFRRLALILTLSLFMGLMADTGVNAGSALNARLIIANKYVTGKTYTLKKGNSRQLSIRVSNGFGKTSISISSNKKSVATVTSKGLIRAKGYGTAKITAKIKCRSGKRTKTKSVWVKIKVPKKDPSATSSPGSGALTARLVVNGATTGQFAVSILDNAAGRQLYASLPRVLTMFDSGNNTKTAVETNLIYEMDEYKPTNLVAGDFMLYGNSRYELTYADHTSGFAYTRLGRVQGDMKALAEALGSGVVTITLQRGTLPTVPPTMTVAPTKSPGPSATPWPSGVPTPTVSPWPSGVPTPTGSATVSPWPSGVPTPTNTAKTSATPTSSSTPTPTQPPVYQGPRIKITTEENNEYHVIVNTASEAANAFYNSLSSGPKQVTFRPNSTEASYLDRYWGILSSPLTDKGATTVDRWSAGMLVLFGTDELYIFRTKVQNFGTPSTILGTIDSSTYQETSFLRTMFPGGRDLLVTFAKDP